MTQTRPLSRSIDGSRPAVVIHKLSTARSGPYAQAYPQVRLYFTEVLWKASRGSKGASPHILAFRAQEFWHTERQNTNSFADVRTKPGDFSAEIAQQC